MTILARTGEVNCLKVPMTTMPSQAARLRMIELECGGLIRADWLRVVFLHFEIAIDDLQSHVPFELDSHRGRAYISVVAFIMRRFRPRGFAAIGSFLCAPFTRHGFLNVRTYVRHQGEAGICFLTEWINNPLSVLLGPRTYGLPYRLGRLHFQHDPAGGKMAGEVRAAFQDSALKYRASIEQPPRFCQANRGSLDEFLLERYSAFMFRGRKRRRFRIWHQPWAFAQIEVSILDRSLLDLTGPMLREARLVGGHFSPGVKDVWIGLPVSISI